MLFVVCDADCDHVGDIYECPQGTYYWKTLSVLGYLIRIQYKQVTMKTKQTCFVPEDKWPVV